jgi:predicted small lipoprotein YifL
LYGAARIGDFVVISNYSPTSSRWAVILLSAAVLALGGCGRKGPLDLPPSASAPSAAAAQADADAARAASKPSVFDPTYGSEAPPTAPKGGRKAFVLDPLLND